MKFRKSLSVCTAVLIFTLCLFSARPLLPWAAMTVQASDNITNTTDEQLQVYADTVAAIVNEERAAEGLSALYVVPVLNEAAAVRAQECAQNFSHTRPDGRNCRTVLDEFDISWFIRGENIAYGYKTPELVMEGWMNSEGHRNNIMESRFTHIGVGVAVVDGVIYWSQIFIGGTSTTEGAYLPEDALSGENTASTTTATTETTLTLSVTESAATESTTKKSTTAIESTTTTITATSSAAAESTAATEATANTESTAATESTTTAPATATGTSTAAIGQLPGDINLDGQINLQDAVLLNQFCASAIVLENVSLENGDCNGDGEVDVSDSLTLLQFLVHTLKILPGSE